MIRAVLFDIDGVLFDSVKANAAFYRDLFEHFGYQGPTDEEQQKLNYRSLKGTIIDVMHDVSLEKAEEVFAYAQQLEERLDLLELTSEAPQVLAVLHATFKLGVVSMRIRSSIEALLTHGNLSHFFAVRVGFEDTEKHKPDPDPLLLGAQQFDISPAEVVYVGDMEVDVRAAEAAGMKMVHYSLDTLPGDHITIGHFRELSQAIARL